MKSPQERAYQTIKKLAATSHSPLRLARLAAGVKLAAKGKFDEVIESIEDMKKVIKEEQKADMDERDDCKDKYQKIKSKSLNLEWKIENNEALMEKLETKIEKDKEEKALTIEQIEDVLKEIAEMEDVRKEENKDFIEAKEDDENAIKLVKKAR